MFCFCFWVVVLFWWTGGLIEFGEMNKEVKRESTRIYNGKNFINEKNKRHKKKMEANYIREKIFWGKVMGSNHEDADLDIDPIPKDMIAGAELQKLKAKDENGRVFVWLLLAVAMLTRPEALQYLWEDQYNISEVNKVPKPRRVDTDDIWERHIVELDEVYGLLGDMDRAEALHFAKLFLVKKSGRLGRVIFNCRQANNLCKDAPGVNFARQPDLLRRIDEITRGKGLWAFEMDERHAFYNLPVSRNLASHFVISSKVTGKCYAPRSAPMGWKASPFCQQSVLYGAILKDIPKHLGAKITTEIEDSESPPAWIEIFEKDVCVGLFTCYLDNVLVVCSDEKMRTRWSRWIMGKQWVPGERDQEFNKTIGGRMKEYHLRVKTAVNTCTPTYLGLEFGYDSVEGKTKWRHIDGAGGETKDLDATSTKRDMASTIGWLMWDSIVRLRGPSKIGWALEILSRETQGVKKNSEWDVNSGLGPEVIKRLNEAKWEAMPTEEEKLAGMVWMEVEHQTTSRSVLASDASMHTLAVVLMDRLLGRCVTPIVRKAGTSTHRDIFLKELEALTLAVESDKPLTRGAGHETVVLCDNAAVVNAVRKGWSAVPGAGIFLSRIYKATSLSRLTVLRVPGKENVADSPTRNAELEQRRLDASWAILDAHDHGGGCPSVTRTTAGRKRYGKFVAFVLEEKKRQREEDQWSGSEHGESDMEGPESEWESDEEAN